MRSLFLYSILLAVFPNLLSIYGESRIELKTGISVSDYQPEFQKRYYTDDLIAGGSDGLGFGAVNKRYSQKYSPSILNPMDFRFFYSTGGLHLLTGLEILGSDGIEASKQRSTYDYPAIGFFKGNGEIHSKTTNANFRLSAGNNFGKVVISALLMGRSFQSECEKKVTLYSPGFLGLVHAESNYSTSNIFTGLSIVKLFDKGKITGEISYRPKSAGLISSSGKIEQVGAIRFPVDILTGNLSSDLLVVNYLYGEKKPNIYGMRILMDYQYPVFQNFAISFALDYDRLYVSYENYQPPAFFRFANNSGISKTEIAYAEMLSSYNIYREPILNEIRTLRLSVSLIF